MPAVGTISNYLTPGGPGVRLDTSAYEGYEVPPNYDSMIGKLIVSALDWEGAVRKARRALDEYHIEGFTTNIALHREIVRDTDFKEGKFNTSYLDGKMDSFNLGAESNIKNEEQKYSMLASLIKKIKEHKLVTRS
jgi:pyruvate carboxylase subunit A